MDRIKVFPNDTEMPRKRYVLADDLLTPMLSPLTEDGKGLDQLRKSKNLWGVIKKFHQAPTRFVGMMVTLRKAEEYEPRP